MQRTERLVFLSVGAIIQGIFANTDGLILIIVLAILMIASNITAIHRLLHSFHRLRDLSHYTRLRAAVHIIQGGCIMGGIGPMEIIIILLIVLVIFGPKRLLLKYKA